MTVWIISWVFQTSRFSSFPQNSIVYLFQYSSPREKLTCLEAVEFNIPSLKSFICKKTKQTTNELSITFCFIGGIVLIPTLQNEKREEQKAKLILKLINTKAELQKELTSFDAQFRAWTTSNEKRNP